MESEEAAALIAGFSLSCLMLLRIICKVLFHFSSLGRSMRQFLKRTLQLFRAGKARRELEAKSAEQERLRSELLQVRLYLAHCLLSVYAAVVGIIVAANMTTLSMRNPTYLTLQGSWLLISGLAVLNCYAFLPQRLLKVSLLNVWFIFFVIACILFAMPFNLPVFRIFDALVIALLLRIPTSLLATRTLWVALGNLTLSLLIVWRLWSSGTMLQSGSSLPLLLATMLECAVSSLAVVFSLVMSEIMRQRASLRCENKKISYDNSAISALLRLMSDAVIELDQDLRLIRHSPELSAMLMRDRPGASTEGLAFSDFIHSADAARAVELLLDPIGVTSESGTCAHAFHTRLVDTFSNKVCVEVFTIKTENAEGQVRHLLGLRDFTDSHSLSADRAMDAMDSAEDLPFSFSWPISSAESLRADITGSIRSDAAAITSSASTDQEWPIAGPVKKQAYLDLDMEVKVIASASSSVTFVAGLSLDDFFPSPHTLQLLQQVCDEAQRSFDSDGSIPNKVFNFEDLPVQWTPEKYGTLVGAFQVVRTRFGGLGILLAFDEPDWSQSPHRHSRASGRSTSSRASRKHRSTHSAGTRGRTRQSQSSLTPL